MAPSNRHSTLVSLIIILNNGVTILFSIQMGRITGSGRTGKNSTFKLAMPVHTLSFTSKVKCQRNSQAT